MKKSIKFLMTTVALTAGVLAFSKAESKAAVVDVAQTDAEDTKITLQWSAALGAQSYAIQLSEDGNSNWVTMETTSSTNESIRNLASGHTYYVRVGGFNSYSWDIDKENTPEAVTGWSDPVEMVTAPSVNNMTLTQIGASTTSITMKCSEVPGANLYQLSNDAYNDFSVIGESNTTIITTSKDKALTPGTSYSIYCYPCRVAKSTGFIARDGHTSQYGKKTLTKKVATNNFGFTSIWYNINSYSVGVLASDALGDFDGVQVQLQTPAGKVKKTLTSSGTSTSVNNTNGTFYRYRIRTYVDCGTEGKAYSAWSGYRYFGAIKTNDLSVTSSKKKIKINWSKVANANGYTVYISTNENAGFKKVKTVSNKSRSLTITKCGKNKLKANKRYYLRICTNAKVGKKTYKSELFNTTSVYVSKY